jgi:hypothetical protein
MCLTFQFCTHHRVWILNFLLKSHIRCTLLDVSAWRTGAGAGQVITTLYGPELHLDVFRLKEPVLLLDLSTQERIVLHLDMPAKQGSELHLDVFGQQVSMLVWTSGGHR